MGVARVAGEGGLMSTRTVDEQRTKGLVGAGSRTPVCERFLLVAEVARLVNPDPEVVSPNLLYRLIQNDQLPAIKIGDRRKYVVPAQALTAIVARVLGEEPPPTVGLIRQPASAESIGPRRPLVLSVAQAARLLRVCRATIERAYLADQFPVLRWNKRVTVPMKAIDEMEAAALTSGGLVYASDWSSAARAVTAEVAL
jgi:hypothetical protein